jgi:predicted AAA+ superfamily ATPase
LFHEASRFDVKGKEFLAGKKKYYLNDLAFRNFLSSSFDPGLGHHLENAIYLHFRQQGYRVYVGSIGGLEIDFVIEKGDEKKYVQVAYSIAEKKVLERELVPLQNIRDAYEKLIITLDDVSFGNHEGIKHHCAWSLL